MASSSYVLPLRVTLYDLDFREQVSCATLFRYFEETAMRASVHLGFDMAWYRARGQFWVIRTMRMERLCAVGYEEELNVRTWVSAMSRVRADRNYAVRLVRDGRVVARGVANWVYVDAAQMAPTRIDPYIISIFDPDEPPVLSPLTKLVFERNTPTLFETTVRRRAQFYEADSAQHINNAVYVDWVEEAIRAALGEMGYRLPLDRSAPLPWFYRHSLAYARAAVPGDVILAQVCLVERGQTSGKWQVTLSPVNASDPFLRAAVTMLWSDSSDKPVRWERAAK